jgi:hypothetical protein
MGEIIPFCYQYEMENSARKWLKKASAAIWAAMVYAYYAGPNEAVSKFALWAKFFGHPDLPGYLAAKATDFYVLIGAAIIFVLLVWWGWILPWWRKKYPRLIPIQEAALLGYEEAERLGLEKLVSSVHQDLSDKLTWFLYAFLVDEKVRIYGKKAPSRISRLIPREELIHLHPHPSESRLISDFASQRDIYDDVVVRRVDLRRYLKNLRRLSEAKL